MMRNLVIFTACVLCSIAGLQAQQKFNVQNETKTEFYDDLETAVKKAVSGDTIYLPGGVIQYPNETLIIDKKLALIGAGWDTDSIGGLKKTELQSNGYNNVTVNFREGSNGSLITGCNLYQITFGHRNDMYDYFQNIENIIIFRNYIYDVELGINNQNNQVKNIIIKENIITAGIHGNEATNCRINNNLIGIFYYGGGYYNINCLKNSHIYNNVFRSNTTNSSVGREIKDCVFENNFILMNGGLAGATNCIFNHNAFTNEINFPNGSNIGANNLVNQETIRTFQVNDLSQPKNLKIRDTSPCKNAGADGTDIGIYGGTEPYMAIPFNPHIEKAVVSSQTDKNGNLKVDIKVSSRDR